MFRRPGASRPSDEPPDLPEDAVPLLDPTLEFRRPRLRTMFVVSAVLAAGLAALAWWRLRPTPAERRGGLRELARSELLAERPESAEALLSEALTIDPGDADALFLLGALRQQTGRPEDAERAYRDALARRPRHVPAGTALARLLLRRGARDEALDALDRVVRAAGSDATPRSLRAEVRLEAGDLEGALEDLRAVAEQSEIPQVASQCLLAGHVADFLARTARDDALRDVAADLYRRVPGLVRPRAGDRPLVAAEAHLASGRTRTALGVAESEPPGAAVAVLRAEALRADGAAAEAEVVLREEVERQDSAVVRAALVRLLAREGRTRNAALELEEARRRFPDDAAVRHAGRLAVRSLVPAGGEPDLVAAILRVETAVFNPAEPFLADRVLTHSSGETTVRAALALRGDAAVHAVAAAPGSDDDLRALRVAVDDLLGARPDDPAARTWRGALRLRAGNAGAACDDLDVAVAAGAGPPGRFLRALARGASARWADALEDVRAAHGTDPRDPVGACVEVRVWLGLGDPESALGVARRAAARWPADLLVAWHLRAALGAVAPGPAAEALTQERRWLDTRLRVASLGPDAFREAIRRLADEDAAASAPPGALVGLWDDIAAEWAERERADPSDPRAPLAHAESLARAGRPRRAEAVLRAAADRLPADSVAVARSRLLARLGAYDAAESVLRPLLAANPGNPELEIEMGVLLVTRGRTEDGLASFRRVVAMPGAPPALRAEAALALVSGADVAPGDAELVLAWLGSPAGDSVDTPTRRLLDGTCRLALGQTEAAAAAGAEVLAADPARVRAAVLAARAWLVEDRPDRAEEVLARTLVAAPGDPVASNLASHVRLILGLRAFDAGDRAAAAGWWEAACTGSDLDFVACAALADHFVRGASAGEVSGAAARIAARRPGGAPSFLLRGRVEDARGRPDAARADFREALARDPAHVAPVSAFVEAALAAGALDDAERACRRAIDAGDRFGFVRSLLARVHVQRGDLDAAEREWREVLRADPGNYGVLGVLTDRLLATNRAEEARALVASARPESLPEPGVAERFGRLRAYVETGPVAGAIDRMREVLGGRPAGVDAMLALGRALAATGDAEAALPWLERAYEAAPGRVETGVALLHVLGRLGRLGDAESRLRERVRDRPGDGAAWTLLGMLASARGDRGLAEQNYVRALAASPGDPVAANNLACVIFEDAARRDEAVERIARAARERPEVPHLEATHVWFLLRSGEASAALEVTDRAVARHPGHGLLRLHRAEALLALGRRDAAVTEYREALRLDPGLSGRAGDALREAASR